MMLTFRSYLTDRSRLISIGELASELARKTQDPENFVLDFVEARFPGLYHPLIESIYLEADPRPPESAGGDESSPDAPAKKDSPGARPANKVQHGTFLGWLNDLFSGGGAAKNFDKAVKAISRVDSVVKTIHIPDEYQQEGGPAAGYDNFRDELKAVLEKMKELGQQSQLLHVADAIKRDPNYVQELEGELADVRSEDEAEHGGEPPAKEGGAIEKVTPSAAVKTELDKHPLGKYAYDAIMRLAQADGEFKEKVTPPPAGPTPAGSKYIPGYLTALALVTVKLYEKDHPEPEKKDDDAVFGDWWNKNKAGILKKAAVFVNTPAPPVSGSEHDASGPLPTDVYHPSHTVHNGDVFAEALVLAGVPQTKKRKTR